jgi:hypothetical protein
MDRKQGEERTGSPPPRTSKLFRVLVLGGAVLAGAAAASRTPSNAAPTSTDDGGSDAGGVPGW